MYFTGDGSGYRSRAPGSIPGPTKATKIYFLFFITRFSEKLWVWKGVHSASWVQKELLQTKSSGFRLEDQDYGHRDPPGWLRDIPLFANVGTNFADTQATEIAFMFVRLW
jgi:hypothetical protein